MPKDNDFNICAEKLCKSLVASILLYECQTWTLIRKERCKNSWWHFRRLLHISYKEQKTNELFRSLVTIQVGPHKPSALHRQAAKTGLVRAWHDMTWYNAQRRGKGNGGWVTSRSGQSISWETFWERHRTGPAGALKPLSLYTNHYIHPKTSHN